MDPVRQEFLLVLYWLRGCGVAFGPALGIGDCLNQMLDLGTFLPMSDWGTTFLTKKTIFL
jgi:hypothetical protein